MPFTAGACVGIGWNKLCADRMSSSCAIAGLVARRQSKHVSGEGLFITCTLMFGLRKPAPKVAARVSTRRIRNVPTLAPRPTHRPADGPPCMRQHCARAQRRRIMARTILGGRTMNHSLRRACFAAAVCALSFSAAAQVMTVTVTGGVVDGSSANGVASFKGIPFAAPPTGERRWKKPQPVIAWQGVKMASDFAPSCMQDAAMLQVHAVAAEHERGLPVLERVDAREDRARAAARDGVDLRRRLRGRRHELAHVRRHAARGQRRGARERGVPRGRVRLPRTPRALARERQGLGQLRPAGHDRGRFSGCTTTSALSAATRAT